MCVNVKFKKCICDVLEKSFKKLMLLKFMLKKIQAAENSAN